MYLTRKPCLTSSKPIHYLLNYGQPQIFEKIFYGNFICSLSFCKNLLRGSGQRNIFIFLFWCLTWDQNSGFTSNKPPLQQIRIRKSCWGSLVPNKIWLDRQYTSKHSKEFSNKTFVKLYCENGNLICKIHAVKIHTQRK